jgi:GNAT superfamily N-acetyltransferase
VQLSSELDIEKVLVDEIEVKAWTDFFAAAPAELGCLSEKLLGARATMLRASALPLPMMNRVIGMDDHDFASEGLLESIAQDYHDAGVSGIWLTAWPPSQPTLGPDHGLAPGWKAGAASSWCKFLFDLAGPLEAPPAAGGLSVRPARLEEAAMVGDIICRSQGMPPMLAPWMAALVGAPRWRMLVACGADDVPLAVGALYIDGQSSWLGMGSTLPEARGQGAQQALLLARLATAKAEGCVVAAVDTGAPEAGKSNPSFNNIVRAGFREVGRRTNFLFTKI